MSEPIFVLKVNRDGSQTLRCGTELVATVGDNEMGRSVMKLMFAAILKHSKENVYDEHGNVLVGPAAAVLGDTARGH